MSILRIIRDRRGASAVEFALTAPIFFAILFGMIDGGLLVWTQVGLQHGAEAAARCASVNLTVCGTPANIQQYAAQNAFGLSLSPSAFTVSTSACGNQVTANYAFGFMPTPFSPASLTLSAQSCFPK